MTSYRALAYHPSLPDGRATGMMSVEADGIRFQSEGCTATARMPFEGLQVKLAGMNEDVPEFSHALAEGWVIVAHDAAILKDERMLQQQELQAAFIKASRIKPARSCMISVVALIGLFAALLLVLWSYADEVVRIVVKQIPMEAENQIGKVLWEEVDANKEIIADQMLQAQLDEVTSLLLPHLKAPEGMTFRFHIAKDDGMINAFSMPGGNVVVYTGLLKQVKRKEQLAGVLAHELAHITERHSLRNVVGNLGITAFIGMLVGDASTLQTILAGGSELLLGQKFSRDAETEADDVAWDTLVRANLDPRGLREFFEILQVKERESMGALMNGPLQWISTHPATEERIQRLKDKERAL
jgi:beta-barrel assembly-enhancing protease